MIAAPAELDLVRFGPRASELVPAAVALLRELRQALEAGPGDDETEFEKKFRDWLDFLDEDIVIGLARLEPPALAPLFELF